MIHKILSTPCARILLRPRIAYMFIFTDFLCQQQGYDVEKQKNAKKKRFVEMALEDMDMRIKVGITSQHMNSYDWQSFIFQHM